MAITEKEEELIEYGFVIAFLPGLPQNTETANKALMAWDQLWKLMERENNFSSQLGSDILDWQIGNWANDLTMLLHNAGKYKELIAVNEQILQIEWGNRKDTSLFHENAKRDIADAYADMGNVEKAYALYREYLEKDSLWGWGWIGYYRLLNDNDEPMFRDIIEELYQKIKKGVHFRNMDDLCRELSDEFNTIGELDKSDYLAEKYELERTKETARLAGFLKNIGFENKKLGSFEGKKIYPNDPCPCGSGKKYKKCCARK
ncbi:MAG: SEC-C domain-containing protein [Clostridiales bacterium]|nr:SEC-C domain-containing protein [Clostridiales bacterium]